MSCDPWRTMASQVSVDRMGPEDRNRFLEHLQDCEDCRKLAITTDPTLAFSFLPVEEVNQAEIDQIRQTVRAMRRIRKIDAVVSDRVSRGLAAGVFAALIGIAVMMAVSRPESEPPSAVPFAGAVGIGTGLTQIPDAASPSSTRGLRIELYRSGSTTTASTNAPTVPLWRIDIPLSTTGQRVDIVNAGYHVRFELAGSVEDELVELHDFELVEAGMPGGTPLLVADLHVRRNRPLILGLSDGPTGPEQLVLKLSTQTESVLEP